MKLKLKDSNTKWHSQLLWGSRRFWLKAYRKGMNLFPVEPKTVCREPACHPETSGLHPKLLRKPHCPDTFPKWGKGRLKTCIVMLCFVYKMFSNHFALFDCKHWGQFGISHAYEVLKTQCILKSAALTYHTGAFTNPAWLPLWAVPAHNNRRFYLFAVKVTACFMA